jgi:simple sugar transport system ATP-binding protein
VAGFSVGENLILDVYNEPPYSSGIALDRGTINKTAAERVADFDIRTTSTATPVGTLSGGNQQKVILAREIGREVRLLVASQPTRGLDVGSIEFVHRRIVEQRDQGLGVLLISSELDEIYALSDRIAVMYEGKITGFRDPDVPAEELGMLMAGATDADAAASSAAARQGRIAGGEAADETGLMEAGLLGVGLPGAAGDGRGPGDGGPPAGDGPGGDGSAGGGSDSGSGPADDSGAEPE